MIKITDDCEEAENGLDISGKIFPLEFDCHFGPWTPECYCELEDLRNEIGRDVPEKINIILYDEEKFGTKLFEMIFISRSQEKNFLVSYDYEGSSKENLTKFNNLVGLFENEKEEIRKLFDISYYDNSSGNLSSNKDSNENIYEAIVADLKTIRSIVANNEL